MRRLTQKIVLASVTGSAMLITLGVLDVAAQVVGSTN